MPPAVEHELVRLSQFAAGDLLLVQGGGGNTSVKSPDGQRMWIKASGLRLAEVAPGQGYLETDLPAIVAVVRDDTLAALPRARAHEESVRRVQRAVRNGGTLRPSLETTFHAVLGPAVLHTHPVYVNAFACMEGGAAALAEAGAPDCLWAPYEPPGLALGRAVDRAAQSRQAATGRPPDHVLLRSHGLIASAADAEPAIETTRRFVAAGERYFGPLPEAACGHAYAPARLDRWGQALEHALGRLPRRARSRVLVSRRAALLEAAADPDQWLGGGPLVPDDVVYNGPKVYQTEITDRPGAWLAREFERVPERLAVAVRGYGVALAGPNPRTLEAMEENLLAHVLVRWLIAARRGRPRPLPPEEVDYLLSMESEKYRQEVAAR